ncbi:MAG: adenylosuccinate lyase [Planctomycetota bacterium]|jgi:adenylosuccinate lyase
MPDRDHYVSALGSRYASAEMSRIFSDRTKYTAWRRAWLALAEAEQELGLPITTEQLDELRSTAADVDFDLAAEKEKLLRHDVMAHLHAWGAQAPKAAGILHLGATSAFITDNSEMLQMREGLRLLLSRAAAVLKALADFAREQRRLACLGYTHGLPAQPTTVGKRACLWMQDLLTDVAEIERIERELPCRSVKGTTGTQASFMELFGGDSGKVKRLERLVADKLGFERVVPVTGQTYPRKLDSLVLGAVAGAAQSASKFAHDMRLLQARHEIEEPFGRWQVGSSAMVYKRNPMRSERICSLARHVATLAGEAAWTASVQWFERTLDDSAARRLYIPETFLATDGILVIWENVASGLVVFPRVIRKNLSEELPFMASEAILMAAARAGGDRQDLHEKLRVHAQAAARGVLERGSRNDFLERIAEDQAFSAVAKDLPALTDPMRFIGRASDQVDEFLAEHVEPVLARLAPARADAKV